MAENQTTGETRADAPNINRREVEARLVAAAWKDEAFAQELRSNPKAAVKRELEKLGVTQPMPSDLESKVLEETPTVLYLVIPPKPPEDALSDADLDQAAGGGDDYFMRSFKRHPVNFPKH